MAHGGMEFFFVGGGVGLSGVLDGQFNKLLSQGLELFSPVDGVARLVGARPGDRCGLHLNFARCFLIKF